MAMYTVKVERTVKSYAYVYVEAADKAGATVAAEAEVRKTGGSMEWEIKSARSKVVELRAR